MGKIKKCGCINVSAGLDRGGYRIPCSNPAKGKLTCGIDACGVHIRAEQLRIVNHQKRCESIELSKLRRKKITAFVEAHKIQIIRSLGNRVIIDFDELKRVIEKLKGIK
jgi:hypothetical protein